MDTLERTTVPATLTTHTPPICPLCRSTDTEPIPPMANVTAREAIETVWAEIWAGRGQQAARYLLRWTCVGAANALQHDTHQCGFCGLRFREGRT